MKVHLNRRGGAGRRAPILLSLAVIVLLMAGESSAGTIDLEAANRLVAGYTRHAISKLPRDWRKREEQKMGENPPHIDADGVFQLMVPGGRIAFEYDAENQRLLCDVVVHKLRREYPLIGLSREEIQTALENAAARGVDSGGGDMVWDPAAGGFFLRKTYSDPPKSLRRLNKELDRLMTAGEKWFRKHYLAAVLSHVEMLAPPPTAKGSRGELQVTLVLTSDLRYQDLWRRPPGALQPKLVSRSDFSRGDEVWVLALFTGANANQDQELRLRAQYTFVDPQGKAHGSQVGNLWWSTPPPADHLQMSEFRAKIDLGVNMPLGDHVARIKVCEPSLEHCLTAETPFHVRAGETPGSP